MSCYNPIPALDNGYKINRDGKRVKSIKILDMRHRYYGYGLDDLKQLFGDSLIYLPCGHCYGCGVAYSKMWSSRIMLETKFHDHNCFLTLTYRDECVPKSGKPSKRHVQLFIKRLRKEIGCKIRYFACGEVGEQKGDRVINPHYHLIIFGYDFPDKVVLKRSGSGMIIYTSELLDRLWSYKDKNGQFQNFGLSSIGTVTPESAQYVAKYCIKRKTTGVDLGEFVLMSRRPGIGVQGFDESDYYTDKLYLNGRKYKIPRYFDKLADQSGSFLYAVAKDFRVERAKQIKPSKYRYCLAREEFALELIKENAIRKDVLKIHL